MRGRDALALSVFVLPFSGAVSAAVGPQAMRLTPIETIGRSVADLAVDTNPFATRLVRPVNATARAYPLRCVARGFLGADATLPAADPRAQAPPSVAAMGLPASLDRWTLFRIDLGELAGIKWERINWKNDKVSPCAEFYVDEVRLIRFAQQPPAQAEEPSQQPQLLSPPPPPPRAPPRSPRSPPPPPDAPDAPVAAAQPQQAATPPARPPPQLVPRPVTPTPSPSPSPSQSSRATPPSTSPPSLDSRLAALAAVQEESPAPPQQKTPQASSSLMDNLRNMVGSSASHAGDTEEELNQHIASRGGFRGILAAAGLQLSEMMNGGVSGPGLSPMGPAMGGAPPGYGPGYSTPENSAPGSLWGVPGGANPAAAQPGGGTTNVAPGVGIQGGGYGGGEPFAGGGGGGGYGGGANVISGGSGGYGGPGGMVAPGVFASGSSAINSGASTNAVDPVYGAGIYGGGGVAGTTGGIPLTTRPSVFYGGSYGGSGVFVAGRSLVRIYLFSSCVHPALAAEWPGCWCFLCYADVSPSTLSIGGQKLLNAYALVANAVAANDIKAAAIQAQRIAGAQAIQQNINQRIVGAQLRFAWPRGVSRIPLACTRSHCRHRAGRRAHNLCSDLRHPPELQAGHRQHGACSCVACASAAALMRAALLRSCTESTIQRGRLSTRRSIPRAPLWW